MVVYGALHNILTFYSILNASYAKSPTNNHCQCISDHFTVLKMCLVMLGEALWHDTAGAVGVGVVGRQLRGTLHALLQ